ncbi:unnamed protein product [Caenorhabditis brenneri]
MSLSRPSKFPLLKLPWLCIKCVLHNSDLVDIIFFATISNRTRRIVQHSNYPLKEIDVHPIGRCHRICVAEMTGELEYRIFWYIKHHTRGNGVPLVLKRNSPSVLTKSSFDPDKGHYLESYSADDLDALKMGIEFMIDLFGCTVRYIAIPGNKLAELVRLGISSVELLHITEAEPIYEPVNIADLKCLLETIKVIDRYIFHFKVPNDFYCDPRIFQCRTLCFDCDNSADWVTLELLCQFDVAQLYFWHHRFSKEDIVSYVTYWFNSENRKLEFLFVSFEDPVSQEDFKIDHLNPMPFCEKRRNRCPIAERWKDTDMSSGMDILRHDGLLATLFVEPDSIVFYIWHKRFPDTL